MLNENKKRMDQLVSLHDLDPELDHVLGTDEYCAFCDEYNSLVKQSNRLSEETRRKAKTKNLYAVTFSDYTEYLVLAKSVEQITFLTKFSKSAIIKSTIIPHKYWDTYFIENNMGDISELKLVLKDESVRVIAKKRLSNVQKREGFVSPYMPFSYLIYTEQKFDKLIEFVNPYEIIQTKKFKSTGRVAINTTNGNIAIEYGQIIIKLPKNILVVYQSDDFFESFSSQDSMVWKEYDNDL